MANLIKFIHTADIHLGKELSSNIKGNSELKQLFSAATKISFQNLVETAVKEDIDFILIAGDLYDREARSIKSSQFFLEQCQKLAEKKIELFIISGNHDPAGVENEVFELPANVHYFASEKVETFFYKKNGKLAARILGQSYREKFEARKMYNYYTAADSSVYNIGLLHTALNKAESRYVPVSKSDLLSKKDIHYWALGHLHQYQKINENPAIFYPGILQAKNIKEKAEKGIILVEVDSNLNSKKTFIPTAPVIFNELEINLEKSEKINNISELQEIIIQKINEKIENTAAKNKNLKFKIKAVILRIIVKGHSSIHKYVENNREELQETIIENLRRRFSKSLPAVWIHSLVLKTAAPMEKLIDLQKNNSLYKNLKELIAEALNEPELNKELLSHWGEIWQGDKSAEDRSNYKFYPDQKLQQEILEEAEKIIISELLGDGK